jgi:hypothetical protein
MEPTRCGGATRVDAFACVPLLDDGFCGDVSAMAWWSDLVYLGHRPARPTRLLGRTRHAAPRAQNPLAPLSRVHADCGMRQSSSVCSGLTANLVARVPARSQAHTTGGSFSSASNMKKGTTREQAARCPLKVAEKDALRGRALRWTCRSVTVPSPLNIWCQIIAYSYTLTHTHT